MKKIFEAHINAGTQASDPLQLPGYAGRTMAVLVYAVVLIAALLFTGCKKQDMPDAETEKQSISEREMNGDMESLSGINHQRLGRRTFWELQQARAATAKYLNIMNAYRAGYEDIHVPVENMGDHFMKRKLVDGVFEIRKPELLVYSKDEHGNLKLGAVEYAVPIDLSPNTPPEGFTGKADVWERNEDFGLWLLHAWVWKKNPDGVFNPTNPSVHVH